MDDLSQIFASPAATVGFFYCSLIGFLMFGAAVVWLQAAEGRRLQPQPVRYHSPAVGRR
jgi:hypothetical protein